MNKKTLISGVLLVGLLSGAVMAHPKFESAAEKAEFKEKMRHGKHHRMEDGKDLFRAALRHLDLTDEQKEQLKAVKNAKKGTFKVKRQEIHGLKKQMRQLMNAEQIDEGAIKALSLQIAELKADQLIQRAQLKQEVMKLLTDEQKSKLEAIKEKRIAKMKTRHEKMKQRFEME
ncbi:MAG: Spy/CpxP family protein refolding chaperone [Kangiellaceae bacterium]|nr:Spy/CpxP family protein refolding chaperone [Kangiellaceae bacterium]